MLVDAAPVDAVDASGKKIDLEHGRNLHLKVRPEAPVQLLFTGHMDTVFAADHPFQQTRWLDDEVLNGPGVADMKGGIAVMLAALKAVEASGAAPPRLRGRHQQRRGSRLARLGRADRRGARAARKRR